MSCGSTRNTAAPPWPCSGFITTAPCSSRNELISSRSREISVGGIKCGKFITKSFSGALRTDAGIVHDQRLGVDALEEMRRGDVGEVERRVLPQQDDVEGFERFALRLAEREMIADLVAHGEQLHRRHQFLAAQRELVRRVIGKAVAALLRFQQQREGRIAADVDARDGVHLDGDIQFHIGVRVSGGFMRFQAKWVPVRVRKRVQISASWRRMPLTDGVANAAAQSGWRRNAGRIRHARDAPPATPARRR